MAFKKERGKEGREEGKGRKRDFGSKTAALNNITLLKVDLGEKTTKKHKTLQCQNFPRSSIHTSNKQQQLVCVLHIH